MKVSEMWGENPKGWSQAAYMGQFAVLGEETGIRFRLYEAALYVSACNDRPPIADGRLRRNWAQDMERKRAMAVRAMERLNQD